MMKSLTALATAGVIATAAVAAPAPAHARNEGAIVGAAVGGLVVGGLIGSAYQPYPYGYGYGYGYAPRPVYYGGPYAYSRCHIVRQRIVTDYGPRWRQTRVCD
jgi:hypothetical protein